METFCIFDHKGGTKGANNVGVIEVTSTVHGLVVGTFVSSKCRFESQIYASCYL